MFDEETTAKVRDYISNQNEANNLGLTEYEINVLAELYLLESYEHGKEVTSEVDDQLFEEIYDDFVDDSANKIPDSLKNMLNTGKELTRTETDELEELIDHDKKPNYDEKENLDEYDGPSKFVNFEGRTFNPEREINANNGYGYMDSSYDDQGLDERVTDSEDMFLGR